MHSTMSIVPNTSMENAVFRHQFGLSLTRSVLKRSSGDNNMLGGTSRCLFGVPDPKQAKDVVRETELKNAINFGKRYNFDIVNGEPFPHAKRRKLSHSEDSDEENRTIGNVDNVENDNEGYVWTEIYNQDQMAVCNKQAILAPNQYSAPAVSLLCAITTVHVNQAFSPNLSSASLNNSYSSIQTEESQEKSSSSQPEISSNTCLSAIIPSSPLNLVSSNETNNNNIINIKSHSNPSTTTNITEKKLHRNCSNSYHSLRNTHRHHQSFSKKSSLSIAHHIITKYANRILRHAVKKPRKSVITDYLHLRRTTKTNQQSRKKH